MRSYHPDAEVPFADLAGHGKLATIPEAMRNMFRPTAHMMTNHLVEVAGDGATGSVLCTARHLSVDPARAAALTVIIRYIDDALQWQVSDLALWDNRSFQIQGEWPVGPS